MSRHVIDEMPTLTQVEQADAEQIVEWHLYLRPTMMNEELDIVKAIARKYDAMPPQMREGFAQRLRLRYVRGS